MNNPKKIMIIGSPGAGKTVLADQMGGILDIEVYHLDWEFWKPGWQKTNTKERLEKLVPILGKESWILDGTYKDTLEIRLRMADCVIFLDQPRLICLWRVITRRLRYIGRTPLLLAPGCPDKIDWKFLKMIWEYPDKDGKILHSILKNYCDKIDVLRFRSPSEVKQYLKTLIS